MMLTEANRQTLLLVTVILALICFFSSFLLFVCAAYVKIKIDSQMTLIETYNSNVLPAIFVFVGVLNLIQNVSTVFISFKLMDIESRDKIMMGVYPVLIGGIVLVLFEMGSSIASFVHISILDNEFGEGLNKAMGKYIEGGELKREMDSVQINYNCCGDKSYTDWFKYSWLETESVRTSGDSLKKYLQSDGKYYSDDTPFSCCDIRSPRPCIHHHIHDTRQHHLYNFNMETTLHSAGCRDALMAIYGNVLLTVGLIALVIACVKICVLLLFRLLQTSLFKARDMEDWEATTNAYLYTEGPEEPDDAKLKEGEGDDSGVETGDTTDDSSTSLAESDNSAAADEDETTDDDTGAAASGEVVGGDGTEVDVNQSYNLPGVWQGYFMPSYEDQGLNESYSFPVYTRSSHKSSNVLDNPMMADAGQNWPRIPSEPIKFPDINLNAKDNNSAVGFPHMEQSGCVAPPTSQEYCMQLFQPFKNLPEISGTGDTIGPSLIDKIKAHITGSGSYVAKNANGRGYAADPYNNYRYSMLRNGAGVPGDSDDENNNRNNEVLVGETSSGDEKPFDYSELFHPIRTDFWWARYKNTSGFSGKRGVDAKMKSIPRGKRLFEMEYNNPCRDSGSIINDDGLSPIASSNALQFREMRKRSNAQYPATTFYQENEFIRVNKENQSIARKNMRCKHVTRASGSRVPVLTRVISNTKQENTNETGYKKACKLEFLPREMLRSKRTRCYTSKSPPSSNPSKASADLFSGVSQEKVGTTLREFQFREDQRVDGALSSAGKCNQRGERTETTNHYLRGIDLTQGNDEGGAYRMPRDFGNTKLCSGDDGIAKQTPCNATTAEQILRDGINTKHMLSNAGLKQSPRHSGNSKYMQTRCWTSKKMICNKETTNNTTRNNYFTPDVLNNVITNNGMSGKSRASSQMLSSQETSDQTFSYVNKSNQTFHMTNTVSSNVNQFNQRAIGTHQSSSHANTTSHIVSNPNAINLNKPDVSPNCLGPNLISTDNLSKMASTPRMQYCLLKFRQRINDKFKKISGCIAETTGNHLDQIEGTMLSQSTNLDIRTVDFNSCSSSYVPQKLYVPQIADTNNFTTPGITNSTNTPTCLGETLKDSTVGFPSPTYNLTSEIRKDDCKTVIGPIQNKFPISFSMPGSPPISHRSETVSLTPSSRSFPCVSRNHVRSYQKQIQKTCTGALSYNTARKISAPCSVLIKNVHLVSAPKTSNNRTVLSTEPAAIATAKSYQSLLSHANQTININMIRKPNLKLSQRQDESVTQVMSNISLASITSRGSIISSVSSPDGNLSREYSETSSSTRQFRPSDKVRSFLLSNSQVNKLTTTRLEIPQHTAYDYAKETDFSIPDVDQQVVQRVDFPARRRVDENGRPVISPFY